MPLDSFRGWVERLDLDHDPFIQVRWVHTNTGVEEWAEVDTRLIPAAERAKLALGMPIVFKLRSDRGGRVRRTTFKVIEKFWTKHELKQVRIEARKLAAVFGVDDHAT
jgi:hypothetical protein